MPLSIPPRRPLLVHHGAARSEAVDASPWAVAVVGVSGGMAVVARPSRVGVVVMVVFVSPCCRDDLLVVVVFVLLPLWLGAEAHLERLRRVYSRQRLCCVSGAGKGQAMSRQREEVRLLQWLGGAE